MSSPGINELIETNSSSDDFELNVYKFIESFPNPPRVIHFGRPWVFCTQSKNTPSVVVGTPMHIIHNKIISTYSNISLDWRGFFGQFWVPVIIDGIRKLSSSGHPFAVTHLSKDFVMYRLHSQEIHHHIDENGPDIEYDPMIVSGGPATAFLNRFPYVDQNAGKISIMLPICLPFDTYCIGVLEFTMYAKGDDLGRFVLDAIEVTKRAGLDVCNVQEQIPYKTINGLRDAKDEIKHALEIVGGLHSLSLAQVWIACKDKCHMALPFYLANAPKFGLKLTGYLHDEHLDEKHNKFGMYNRLCDVMPLGSWENFVLKTLQDYKSRYMVGFRSNMLINWEGCYSSCRAFTICLRGINNGDIDYAFEFSWVKHSDTDILLESIPLVLKSCLPDFKFSSGEELGDELDVIKIDTKSNQISNFKIFEGKRLSPMPKALDKGKQPMVVDYIAPSEMTCNTTLKVSPPEQYKKILDVICVESTKSFDPSQCKGSQSNSFSDDFDMNVSEFLEAFPNPPPQMLYESESLRVFCSQSKNNSSSADVGTPINIIHHKIMSAFSNMESWPEFFGQFWVPVTIDDKLLLSTLDQPFAVTYLSKDFVMFRLCSEKYTYNLDVNKLDIEGDPMILNGGPATAFLNHFPTYFNDIECFQLEYGDVDRGMISIMLPICFPSKSYCIGVLELAPQNREYVDLGNLVLHAIDGIKEAGLDVYYVQDIIPYKIISGLKLAKEEIEEALKVVCESHNLALAQAWIACEDKSHVLLSSSLEDNKSKKLFAIKLTGYLYAEDEHIDLDEYNRLCDLTPRVIQGELPLDTLQDYESRYISEFFPDMVDDKEAGFFHNSSAFEICLRSIDTGDFDYAFEFIWVKHSNYIIFLEALLLTLKRCLPRFKFASGVDLGDELYVIVDEADNIKIFKGERSSPMLLTSREEGKKQMLVDYMTHSEETCKTTTKVLLEDIEKQLDLVGTESPPTLGETSSNNIFQEKTSSAVGKAVDKGKKPMVKCKTAEILLTREDIEKQFCKPMKEAAENLKVSLSTLKRKLRKLGILEWPRTKPVKRNKNDLSVNQTNTNDQDKEATQKPSIVNVNHNTITIKAEYADDMIKICLPILQATFVNVEKEIGMKFNLSLGTYKLKYRDEVGDLILLTSDEDMSSCIESSKKFNPNEVRLSVLPVTNIRS